MLQGNITESFQRVWEFCCCCLIDGPEEQTEHLPSLGKLGKRTVIGRVLTKGHSHINSTAANQGPEGSYNKWGPCLCLHLLVHVPPTSAGHSYPVEPKTPVRLECPVLLFDHGGEGSWEAGAQAASPVRPGIVVILHPEEAPGTALT